MSGDAVIASDESRPVGQPLDVVIVHETNGRKYFEAIVNLHQRGELRSLSFYEPSVLWKFAHSLLRERKPVGVALRQAWRNLVFRLTLWTVRDKVVLLGIAPWDYRLLAYSMLRFRNRMVYHTSWPWWEGERVPKRYGPLTGLMRRGWISVLRRPEISAAAATGLSAQSLANVVPGKRASVISHVVSAAFFEGHATHATPFRLLFLGELSEKKGLLELKALMDILKDEPVTVDIVGQGPLRAVAEELGARPGCTCHGHVSDRATLARIVSSCQLLVSPVIRNERWEELFGMSLIEAMASGVPCIVSDHVGPRSIITDQVDGVLLPEHSVPEIAAWIRRLMNEPATWETLSANAAATAQRYTLDETSRLWGRLLRAAAAVAAPSAQAIPVPEGTAAPR